MWDHFSTLCIKGLILERLSGNRPAPRNLFERTIFYSFKQINPKKPVSAILHRRKLGNDKSSKIILTNQNFHKNDDYF